MKINEKNWIIGIICFMLMFMVTIQIKTINRSSSDILRLKSENELRDEINQWKRKSETYEVQLAIEKQEKVISDLAQRKK